MARGGWDGPVRVFALVRSQVLAADPELAGHLPSDVSLQAAQRPESLFSVEQEGLPPAASVGDLLAQLAWPETVDGAAVSLERIAMPPEAEAEIPEDPAEAEAFAPRTIIMNRGKIVADGGTAQIRRNFGTQHIKLTFDTQENLASASARMARRATVSRSAETLSIAGPDTVALVREVIAFPGISSISITDQSLEEAFEQLTDVGDEAAVSPKES